MVGLYHKQSKKYEIAQYVLLWHIACQPCGIVLLGLSNRCLLHFIGMPPGQMAQSESGQCLPTQRIRSLGKQVGRYYFST